MASLRASALVASGLFFAVGCHLIGGVTDYVEGSKAEDDGGVGASGAAPGTGGAPTGVGGAPGTGGDATTSAGGMATCTDESCMPADECQVCTCVQGVLCDCENVNTGVACSTGYCFNGACVDCIDDIDFPCSDVAETCDSQVCVSAQCDDTFKNGLETGVDCGGPDCAPCSNGNECAGPADCLSGYCPGGTTCQPCTQQRHCAADQYCGGGSCRGKKNLLDGCSADYECFSGNCSSCLGPVKCCSL